MDSFSDMKELLRLAQSPAGQQLIALLRQRGGDRLSAALPRPPPEITGRLRHCFLTFWLRRMLRHS